MYKRQLVFITYHKVGVGSVIKYRSTIADSFFCGINYLHCQWPVSYTHLERILKDYIPDAVLVEPAGVGRLSDLIKICLKQEDRGLIDVYKRQHQPESS